MFRDYKVTIDDDPTPDWLIFLQIALFLVAFPIGVLYLIIKGIVWLVRKNKEKKQATELAIVENQLAKERQVEEIKALENKNKEEALSKLSQWHSLYKKGAISKSEYEKQKEKLMEMLN